jgi:hypothetical protein
MRYVPPSHCVSQQRSRARKILPFQGAQEAPEGWHTPVLTARRAAQCLCCTAALLVLQPKQHAGMTPANVPFSEADLASHILRMCPHQWQDQYNLQEKGMTPMDMRSLQASLEAIKHVCTHEKAHAPSGRKASHKNKAGAKWPSNGTTKQAHKKVRFKKSCELARNLGSRILHTLPKIATSMRKMEWQKLIFAPPRRQVRNPIPQRSCLPC